MRWSFFRRKPLAVNYFREEVSQKSPIIIVWQSPINWRKSSLQFISCFEIRLFVLLKYWQFSKNGNGRVIFMSLQELKKVTVNKIYIN